MKYSADSPAVAPATGPGSSLASSPPLKLALIGFMGSGKSSIGRILSRELVMPFIDLDEELEKRAGRSIAEMFAGKGEGAFRKFEEETLSDLVERGDSYILACGGGVVLSAVSRALLANAYTTVWIDVPFEELMRRLSGERAKRPLLASADYKKRAKELLDLRRPLYESSCRLRYTWREGDSDEDSCKAIMRSLAESRIFQA